uniref:Dynein, axonemal, heavy chain 2 n=1 Tax=Astyanax mexicanus TaxID=7994 RepID=A0A8B9RG35_ASTMX
MCVFMCVCVCVCVFALFRGTEEVFQALEDNQVTLSTMKASRFVRAFEKEVDRWERCLSLVLEVIEMILTVQRQWMYLEIIFLGEDIRKQLPHESTEFDDINSSWKTIMDRLNKDNNALRGTHHPGLLEKLSEMNSKLEEIQKSLDMYLETKRQIFPRFYFLSNDDLLEILGQSRNPDAVQPHLKKCFDNIKRLYFAHTWTLFVYCIRCSVFVQMLITASQIQWTTDVTKCLITGKESLFVMPLWQVSMLHRYSDAIRGNLSKILRLKIVALVTVEVHARDVIDKLAKAGCCDVNAFDWLCQLRLYWEKDVDDCIIRQTNTHFQYGYEYLGNSGRLVITPLTDRCYMTLTTALHLHRGGSPKGPAGTGKTETVKDLGKGLGMYVIVVNCSDGLDYKSMGRMYSGLAQTGAWGCFDEFNRINIEVLSVVAQQILSILSALSAGLTNFVFEGRDICLVSSCGIFITMNPGYAGRTELPDNLKSMFRPISMVVPDSTLIAEITLFGEGFNNCKVLAKKVFTLYCLAVQQLSKQDHYDFGLRALTSLLRYAGKKRRVRPDIADEEILLMSMKDMNIAKLTSTDLPLFNGIIQDLFPAVETPTIDYGKLKETIEEELHQSGLQVTPFTVTKVIQLYETKNSRHSSMIVGKTGSSKSVTWQILQKALSAMHRKGEPGFNLVHEYPLNPKAVSLGELYGEYDLSTNEWTDGVLSSLMRIACADEKWIVFDGPVDTLWIESMNSVMDDNKVLTLINGERIAMPEQVSLLFEVEDLAVASPATVSRCGMVYNDYSDLGWKPYVQSWIDKRQKMEVDHLKRLFDRYIKKTISFKRTHCKELVPITELNGVISLCRLYDSLASPENGVRTLHLHYLPTVMGCLCAHHSVIQPSLSLLSLCSAPFYKIMVPTVDTVRYHFLVNSLVCGQYPVLLTGPVGTGKTSVAQSVLQSLDPAKWTMLTINMSSQTTSNNVQAIIESRVEKRTKGTYVPVGGKKMLAFLDDLNMPAVDDFGSQPPLELLRLWIDYGFWYDRQKQTLKCVKDMFLLASMGPPGGGRTHISGRLQSRFNLINMTFPAESQIKHIFGTMINQKLQEFQEEVKPIGSVLTQATLELYYAISARFLPTPAKIHYLFNLRDISKADTEAFVALLAEKLGSLFDLTYHNICPNKQQPIFGIFGKRLSLKGFMESQLEDYNLTPGVVPMSLVLFRDAIEHVTRVVRVISQPRGNMLLVGIGGSGRQSLSRLAAYICEYMVFQVEVTKQYRKQEFREDIKKLYRLTGVDNKPTVFLFNDTQIIDESFLEDINNILSSGEVPNLYKSDEFEEVCLKENVLETPDAMFNYLIERVRNNLHIVLCMSPVGEPFRNHIRQYPALVNCTTLDWFSEWPQDALLEVAERYLDGLILGNVEKTKVARIFVTMHQSVAQFSQRMKLELKRHNYVTPTNYLELVSGYKKLLAEKRAELGEQVSKLRNGLFKIDDTRSKVAAMSVELEDAKKKVAEIQKQCEEYLVVIVQQKREADEQQMVIGIFMFMLTSCLAVQALESLNKKDMTEIKSYGRPPALVETVMQAVMILRGCEPTWAEAKRQLGESNFIKQLVHFDKDNISDRVLKKIGQYCTQPDFQPEIIGRVSLAAKSLCMWVRAMEVYGRIYRVVEPKRARLHGAMTQLAEKQAALAEAENKRREQLKNQYDEKLNQKEDLRKKSEDMELKLDRAGKLVSGLAGERVRWEQTSLEKDMGYLVGDCLLAAAFLSYMGPFLSNYREELDLEVPCSPGFNFATFLSKPTAVRDWNIQGLPSDAFSTENGVIVTRGNRWPLMVDPQGQALKWIKNMESKRGLKVIDLQMPDFLRILENAVQFGSPVLLQNVQEELDPSLAPILNKSFTHIGGRVLLKLGDKEVEYNPDFQFYITTKLSNPHYTPEISTKTTIVNFAVKEQGLEAQLLGIVVRRERPELEEQKDSLVINIASGKRKLQELEDEILRLLNEATGSLLDDVQLVNTLQTSKITATEVSDQLETSEQTEIKIDTAREAYRPCAQRASILFFVLNDMGRIDPMYQFSLDAYIDLFNLSIEKSQRSHKLEERIINLNDYHTYAVYRLHILTMYTCRGLFERHKLLFSFHMCAKILEVAGKLNMDEYSFFLRGGLVSTCEWETVCNELQKMLIVRSLRQDRVSFCVNSFIINNLGSRFVEPPVLDMKAVVEDSTTKTPLIFVLSPGVDPTGALVQLAEASGMGPSFHALSLGQGQAPIATRLIKEGVKNGHWVFLANCHLSLSWMPQLDKLVEQLQVEDSHPDFRLWLSSSPHPEFPIAILQAGIKMTTEPPKGVKSNMKRLYQLVTESQFSRCSRPVVYRKLLFSLCFFHSILLERKKFLQLGWNIVYSFNDSDFEVDIYLLENLMSLYLDEYEEIPWDALKYLIARVNYGGHVTDDWDRRLLTTYINDYFCEGAVNTPFFKLSSLPTYYIPRDGSQDTYREYIRQLPPVEHPEVFGQHPNADIASQISETRTLFDTLLSLQPQVTSTTATGAGPSREDKVLEISADVRQKVPELVDYESTQKLLQDDPSPLNVVLLQEIQRYNALLHTIRTSLTELEKGIKGLVVMSSSLEEMFQCIHDARVPPLWEKAYPSLKPLASWTRDLCQRVEQFAHWAETAHPPVLFWLSGFTFPTGFLTAVLQSSARQHNVSNLHTKYMHTYNIDYIYSFILSNIDGVFIRGLYLEGAGWDKKNSCLVEAEPMQLVCPMPTIHFRPVENRKKVAKSMHTHTLTHTHTSNVLIFKKHTTRAGRPSFVVGVDLKSGAVSYEHWIKRGTALLMSLDN